MKNRNLTSKEKEFCRRYVFCSDPKKAAVLSGFAEDPEKKSQELLSKEEIVEEISRICALRRQTMEELAAVGYQRLAFGSIADAVSLLYMDNPTAAQLESMDLFSVSEIKRPKDGSMEIKFFDRLKALEKLSDGAKEESGATPVYDAICKGAKALSDCERGKSNEA
ncbi:MAG: terminase small subunit [Eubacteriales bacterium]|nr:terminase small subunit [Eubacteriales bacterium]